MQCNFKSVFRSNYSLLIFSSLTAAGFGDLHLVAVSQQKVQLGDVKPCAGPRLLTRFGMASVASARASGTRPPGTDEGSSVFKCARLKTCANPVCKTICRLLGKRCKANTVSIIRIELICMKEIFGRLIKVSLKCREFPASKQLCFRPKLIAQRVPPRCHCAMLLSALSLRLQSLLVSIYSGLCLGNGRGFVKICIPGVRMYLNYDL